ncbi:MAG: hypothetical protein U7127_25255 [Phormidium sp.]
MSLSDIDRQRLVDLEEILKLWNQRLTFFQKQLTRDADPNRQFQLQQDIKTEVLPNIRQHESEYMQIMIRYPDVISEADAKNAIVQVNQAVAHIESVATRTYPAELITLLQKIREDLNAPSNTAAARLTVILPLLPPILYYEMEINTEAPIVKVWGFIKSCFRRNIS